MKGFSRLAGAVAFCAIASSAHAADFLFSFTDDPNVPYCSIACRDHVGGTVTGTIVGLADNGTSTPTSIKIQSGGNLVGVKGSQFLPDLINGYGFTVSGGNIVDANLLYNFRDDVGNAFQFRFNFSAGHNVLFWNGGLTPVVGVQNAGGFAGATYTPAAAVAVPEPASWALMIAGFGAAGATLRRRKAVAA